MTEPITSANGPGRELLLSVENELEKAKKDSAKAKLKKFVSERDEAQKIVDAKNGEIEDFLDDYEKGRL